MTVDPLDSVIHAITQMEDDPDLNAGTGSYPRVDASIQMDAAVMTEYGFGSVIAIENVQNPVLVSRDVMEKSPHNIMSGDGAVNFARKMGHRYYDVSTEKTMERHRRMIQKMTDRNDNLTPREKYIADILEIKEGTGDTVGAVSRINGKFAVAVSTGGAVPMLRGRVGDTPLIGCGFYCGKNGAIVATGIGEEITKRLLCYNIYIQIGTDSLQNIVDSAVRDFGDIHVGVIAISEKEYVSSTNANMSTGIHVF
ncbi:peptidase T2 asparaginase 2 [mine drainage metagenome]|uniref:Peptidase T2 asparaginase 2 n=1 Tax=mine drainage metagenome TaxID=410659 RepID=T0ZHC5_9ZZZZ